MTFIDCLKEVIEFIKSFVPETLRMLTYDILKKFYDREKKLVDRAVSESIQIIMEKDLNKYYDIKKNNGK